MRLKLVERLPGHPHRLGLFDIEPRPASQASAGAWRACLRNRGGRLLPGDRTEQRRAAMRQHVADVRAVRAGAAMTDPVDEMAAQYRGRLSPHRWSAKA